MASLIFGIISGATAVPLDPRHTVREFATHLLDRGVNALVSEPGVSQAAVDAAQNLGIPVLEIQRVDTSGETRPSINIFPNCGN